MLSEEFSKELIEASASTYTSLQPLKKYLKLHDMFYVLQLVLSTHTLILYNLFVCVTNKNPLSPLSLCFRRVKTMVVDAPKNASMAVLS